MDVSVICPVFNTRPHELRAAVESVLGQDGGVREILLIDDASTAAGTLAVLDEVRRRHGRATVLRSRSNGGPAVARNLGLAHASGSWIGFLDADDIWPSDKLTRAASTLRERPQSHWIIGDFASFRGDDRETVRPGVPCLGMTEEIGPTQCSPALTKEIICEGLHLGTCLIKRALIGERRFNPAVLYGEDLLFLAKLSVVAAADRAPGLSYLCRREGESMMYSAGRLSARFASGPQAGLRDRELRGFRRYHRWALYAVYKDLAVNNLLNGRPATAMRYALRALRLDPRELLDLARFIALLPLRDVEEISRRAKLYSRREQVLLEVGRCSAAKG